MLLVQLRIPVEAIDLPSEVGVAILECYHAEEDESNIDMLNVDFFDDDYVVIVYRHGEGESLCKKRFSCWFRTDLMDRAGIHRNAEVQEYRISKPGIRRKEFYL